VRVVERSDCAYLRFEALAELLRGHLDCHVAVKPRIAGTVDFTHASGTDSIQDFVRPEVSAGRKLHARRFYRN
jgi:hypothetical protein